MYLRFALISLLPLSLIAQTGTPVTININDACYKTITVPARPDFLTADGGSAWVIDDANSLIRKVSISNAKPLLTVAVPDACAAPVSAFNAVWVISCSERKLYKLDKNSGRILARIATGVADPNGEMSLAAGGGSVWLLSDSSGILSRINPRTNTVQARVRVTPHSYCAAYGYSSIWITSTGRSTVQRVDAVTNKIIATIQVGKNPRFISVGEQGVWTLNQGDGTVTKINPATNTVTATIDVKAKGPGGDIAEGGGKVWIVSTNKSSPVQTINTSNNKVETIYSQTSEDGKNTRVDGAVRVSGKFIWVSGLYRQKVWVFKK